MIILAYLQEDNDVFIRNVWRWLDMLKEYEWKLDHHIMFPPKAQHEFIHARYSAHDLKEINTPWSHAQNDAVGGLLFVIGEGIKHKKKVLRDEKDKEIVQKLVQYLTTLRYWECADAGAWEENLEVRTSSIAACVAGLRNVKDIVSVPEILIDNGMDALYELFPYETKTRKQDLAQLTAIFPYRVFGNEMSKIIIENIEKNLLRDKAVLRYKYDSYYSTLEKKYGRSLPLESYDKTEAEWVFGIGYLALAWMELGDYDKAKYYIEKFESLANENGEFPELYMADVTPNKNCPLGWTHAVYINCVQKYEELTKGEKC
jgi:phosphorylase kinase alpha/beta subunit